MSTSRLVRLIIGLGVSVGLYAVLIPRLEATGAAVASTVSYVLTFFLFSHFYRRVTSRKVLPLLVPTRSEFVDLLVLVRAVPSRLRALRELSRAAFAAGNR